MVETSAVFPTPFLDAYALSIATEGTGKISFAPTGWLCPKCGRGVAPGEKTCEHGNARALGDSTV